MEGGGSSGYYIKADGILPSCLWRDKVKGPLSMLKAQAIMKNQELNGFATISEKWFDEYLQSSGHKSEYEPSFPISQNPDFRVSKEGSAAICEVKEFDKPKREEDRPPQATTRSLKTVLKPMRSKIKEAASQLKPLKDSGLPLACVLANPYNNPVPLEPREIVWALYGDATYGGYYNSQAGIIEDLRVVRGRNGKLTNDHNYLSAIITLHFYSNSIAFWEDWRAREASKYKNNPTELIARWYEALRGASIPEGGEFFVRVFHTLAAQAYGTATPLSYDLFNGPLDEHWIPDADKGEYRLKERSEL